MKQNILLKTFVLLIAMLAGGISASWASTVDDLATISSDYTFIGANFTTNGTVALSSATLYDNNRILQIGAGAVATNKGSSTISGTSYLNCVKVKQSSGIHIAFKVSGACSIKIYSNSGTNRYISVGSTAGGEDIGKNSAGETTLTCEITSAGTYYITAQGNELFIAGFEITFPAAGNPPTITTQPVGAEYLVNDEAAALSIVAEPNTAGSTLSYQWYSNSTQSTDGAEAISGATSASYIPSTATAGTTYYYCVVTEAGNDDTARSSIVAVTVKQKYIVAFAAGESGASIAFPVSYEYEAGEQITLPTNHYFYLADNSVSKWSDGTDEYEPGASYTVTGNVTFNPVFVSDKRDLGDEATTITWTFATGNGAPTYAIEGDGRTTSVIASTANGKDLLMAVELSANPSDATKYGKFNNTNNTNCAQVNATTAFSIPAVKGMTVTYSIVNGTPSTEDDVLFGEDHATSVEGQNYIYEYEGSNGTLVVYDKVGGKYPSGITVSYPCTALPGPADPEEVTGTTITWDFSSETAQTAAGTITKESTNTLTATDGTSTIVYKAGKDDAYEASNKGYYLKPNGKSTMSLSGSRYFILNIATSGTLTVISNSGKTGEYLVYQGTKDDISDAVKKTSITTSADKLTATGTYDIADGKYLFIGFNSQIYTEKLSWTPATDDIILTTTANMAGWRSFYDADQAYTVDENTTVYAVTEVEGTAITLTDFEGGIPAGTPVVLKTDAEAETDGTFKMTLTKAESVTATVPAGNMLQASSAAQALSGVYRLGFGDTGVGFYAYSTSSAAAGIVYLETESGAPMLSLGFGDEGTTGIDVINANVKVAPRKVLKDGRIVIETSEGTFLMNGARVK